MNCFWCENKIDEDERYLVVEIKRSKNKQYVCEKCILDNEASKMDSFLKKYPSWKDALGKTILQKV